ncbi:hypothetical protein [Pigmentiphaga kullae]|uniref:Acetyltransferase (GNAT) family protein n=1 Tax=Pigmentiphaga kullae TaxID=151784 RepID=A0A4Q7NLH2_9BURK|nr:hypothetical protein [Pigmentiphaga kullae]RZS85975.1 hypothetical protein EV675_2007 [Pigmentiphaga kullae]
MKFTHRRYQNGDAERINALYFSISGIQRSLPEFSWQWLESPAGESEIWLIEAELPGSEPKLIGHHGVMAENFCFRGTPIRGGKTENTMVLPEYRDKILYPRLEKDFLSNYQDKFDILFSTTGPAPALRLRKALGYTFEQAWQTVYFGSEPAISLSLFSEKILPKLAIDPGPVLDTPGKESWQGLTIETILPQQSEFDLDNLWASASANYGVTPSRTRRDLEWRFWNNPYKKHWMLKIGHESDIFVCVLSHRKGRGLFVDDIYGTTPAKTIQIANQVLSWCRVKLGVTYLRTTTTTDCESFFSGARYFADTWLMRGASLIGQEREQPKMPRKVTDRGKKMGITDDSLWYVTPFFLEGR